jgi:hypothetical protein
VLAAFVMFNVHVIGDYDAAIVVDRGEARVTSSCDICYVPVWQALIALVLVAPLGIQVRDGERASVVGRALGQQVW